MVVSSHEDLLDHILCILGVAQAAERVVHQSVLEHLDETLELSECLGPAVAPPTDLVSVEEVIVHYDTVIVELNPTELVSVES